MKKEIADRWVAALRSGKYEQGYDHLKYKGRYCCLGVLTALAVEEGIYSPLDEFGSYVVSCQQLNLKVLNWAGMKNSAPGIEIEGTPRISLIYLNDSEKKSFNEIADIIEGSWENIS